MEDISTRSRKPEVTITLQDLRAAAVVLGRLTYWTGRGTGEADDAIWAHAMVTYRISVNQAFQIVDDFHLTNNGFMTVADLTAKARENRDQIRTEGPPEFPAGLGGDTPAGQQKAEKQYRHDYYHGRDLGMDRDEAHAYANSRVEGEPLSIEPFDQDVADARMKAVEDWAHFKAMRSKQAMDPTLTERREEAKTLAAAQAVHQDDGRATVTLQMATKVAQEVTLNLDDVLTMLDRAVLIEWRKRVVNGYGLDVRLPDGHRQSLQVVRDPEQSEAERTRGLQAGLDQLERDDPAVAAAAARYRETVEDLTRPVPKARFPR